MSCRLFVLLCLLCSATLSAQLLNHRQGELIVQFSADVDAKKWLEAKPEITAYKALSRPLNVYLLSYDFNRDNELILRREYRKDPAVIALQRNHRLAPRARPDDTRYDDQWHHFNVGQLGGPAGIDHNVEPAWDISTGGVTLNGDTIVAAILDDGVDTDHEDLLPNLWVNRDEIPGNGIDDDNNGYIDDIHGYNTAREDGDVEAESGAEHGTSVAGIIGARGNNALGVTGVNWNIELMIIRNNLNTVESEVIQAYSYALESRLRYDETDGAEGAYVVVTNASWGVNFGNPDDSPIWCGLYDVLGEAGILSVGATANDNIDVDTEGDLPTNCSSEFLIAVTNLNFRDEIRGAGFGSKSIDLGAHGDDVFTTDIGNGYHYFCCTSSATPQVAGAAALLFSAPCENFAQLMAADPAAAARRVKDVLMNNTTPNASLDGVTVSGGKLNIGAAMNALVTTGGGLTGTTTSCSDCLPPAGFEIVPTEGSADALTVSWRAVEDLSGFVLRYRPRGTSSWIEITGVSSPYELTGLPACADYDLQVSAVCPAGDMVMTRVKTVATDGCCVIPSDFRVTGASVRITGNPFFRVRWTDQLAARRYRVRYRREGAEDWLVRTVAGNQIDLAGNIAPCTNYEFEFQTNCDTLVTDFGKRTTVLSFGCGACLEEDYCTPNNFNNEREWIADINIGGLLHNASGAAPDGYRSYGEITSRSFVRGGVYPVVMIPGFTSSEAPEEFRIYVDWNQDGNLLSTEEALEVETDDEGIARGQLVIPEDADLLLTRLRVIMQFRSIRGGSCLANTAFGEVEDYCINIAAAEGCPPPTRLLAEFDPTAESTLVRWEASAAPGGSYLLRYRPVGTQDDWVEISVNDTRQLVEELNLCGAYEIGVASVCDALPGDFRTFTFSDLCVDTDDRIIAASDWSVFPNPAAINTTVTWRPNLRVTELQLFDLNGRILHSSRPTGEAEVSLSVSSLPAGIYALRLVTGDGKTGVRRVVVR